MESQSQNPEFRINPETFTHELMFLFDKPLQELLHFPVSLMNNRD